MQILRNKFLQSGIKKTRFVCTQLSYTRYKLFINLLRDTLNDQ